jgi:hypothetical protein
MNLEKIIGKTFTSVEQFEKEKIKFTVSENEAYLMLHSQDCCESVLIDDIAGDLQDLVGSPILQAEVVASAEPPSHIKEQRDKEKAEADAKGDYYCDIDSETWTFYKLATIKGSVTIRWRGESNGYYSESVDFEEAI